MWILMIIIFPLKCVIIKINFYFKKSFCLKYKYDICLF